MSTVRIQKSKENPYVQIDRNKIIRNHKAPAGYQNAYWMSCRMLLIVLLDKPDDWKVYVEQLAEEIGISRDTVYGYLKCLISAGFCSRTIERNEKGQIIKDSSNYIVYEDGNAPFETQFIKKNGESYEQTFCSEKEPKNNVHDVFSANSEGFQSSNAKSSDLGTKKNKKNKEECLLKEKEDTQGSYVDNSESYRHSENLNDSQDSKEKIVFCTKSGKDWAKKSGLSREDCEQKLYENWPFSSVEEWLNNFDARDVCNTISSINDGISHGKIKLNTSHHGWKGAYDNYLTGCLRNLKKNLTKKQG